MYSARGISVDSAFARRIETRGQEAYDAAILAFGPHPFEETLNTASLQLLLKQVGGHSPRVMLHVNPTVGELQDE